MDLTRSYRFARGFSFRRESFGGIIYHFEGVQPDPRLYFVDSPFLIGLLELLEAGPVEQLIGEVRDHFGLNEGDVETIVGFLATLESRGAFVAT